MGWFPLDDFPVHAVYIRGIRVLRENQAIIPMRQKAFVANHIFEEKADLACAVEILKVYFHFWKRLQNRVQKRLRICIRSFTIFTPFLRLKIPFIEFFKRF